MTLSEAANYYEIAAASVDRSVPEIAYIANHFASSEASASYGSHVAAVEHSLNVINSYLSSVDRALSKGKCIPAEPIFAQVGLKIGIRKILDELEEGVSTAIKQFAGTKAGHTEAQSIPPHLRTQAFNIAAAHYEKLLDDQEEELLNLSFIKDGLVKWYPKWKYGFHFSDHARNLKTSEAITSTGGQLDEKADSALVTIAIVSVFLGPWLPFLYTILFADPRGRQQPYKKKKKKGKPQKNQQQQQQQSTTYKNTNNIKQKAPTKPKKYQQIRTKKKTRKTNSFRTPTVDEMKRCKQRWMDRMYRVHMEAGARFKRIRQELDSRNLERSEPKVKKTSSRAGAPPAVPACNPSLVGIGKKAGKSQFLIQVGAVEHLYKTSKPATRREKGCSLPYVPCVDLHGMTKSNALRELDENLPHWIDAAMKGSYPWVIPVKIICGGGNQVLSEAVVNWIRENKQVSNARKERVS